MVVSFLSCRYAAFFRLFGVSIVRAARRSFVQWTRRPRAINGGAAAAIWKQAARSFCAYLASARRGGFRGGFQSARRLTSSCDIHALTLSG